MAGNLMDPAMKPVPRVLLVKAHVPAHTRKDGTQVRAYDTRVQARATPETKDWRDEENWHTRTQMRMRTLSDDALHYIVKDATEAAEAAEKMGSRKAGQYRDEAHYASDELYRRRRARGL
jgi:hypothetical protein